MKHTTYARIENGVVAEIFLPAFYEHDVFVPSVTTDAHGEDDAEEVVHELLHAEGDLIPIEARFHADLVAELVPMGEGVALGDSYDGVAFGPPPALPEPTAAATLQRRDALLGVAALRIAPLQDAADLDEASAAEAEALQAWKRYRVALSRIEQQVGFPGAVEWPAAPS